MKIEEVRTTWDQVIFDTMLGVDGYCRCGRPGYDRKNPDNCRWCKKPFKEIYLNRSRKGEIVSYDEQMSRAAKAEAERELREYKEKYGDEDPFVWLEGLAREKENQEKAD